MAEKRFRADRGGIVSNTDVGPISPVERARREEELTNLDVVSEAMDEAKRRGGDGATFSEFAPGEDVVVHASPDRVKEKSFRAANRSALKPVGLQWTPDHPRGFIWVLTDADQKAVEAGFYCENCLQAQHAPQESGDSCVWRDARGKSGAGCGWVKHRGMFGATRIGVA